jgi:TldD protein
VIATAPPTTGVLDSHWSPTLEDLLACGRSAGADLVEVFLERTDHLGVLAEQDTITSVTPAFGMGAGIRVFLGKRDGFVSTNDLSPAGLRRALEQALGMLGLAPGSSGRSGFEGLPGLRDFAATKADWLQRCPELKEATARLLEGTDQLQRQGKHLQAKWVQATTSKAR